MSPAIDSSLAPGIVVASVIGAVVLYVWIGLALSRLFHKSGVEAWKAWVPVLNTAVLLQLGGFSGWLVLLGLVVGPGSVALAVVLIVACHRINVSFGHGAGMTVLAALLFPVWASVLGFGASRWVGRESGRAPGPMRSAAPDHEPGAVRAGPPPGAAPMPPAAAPPAAYGARRPPAPVGYAAPPAPGAPVAGWTPQPAQHRPEPPAGAGPVPGTEVPGPVVPGPAVPGPAISRASAAPAAPWPLPPTPAPASPPAAAEGAAPRPAGPVRSGSSAPGIPESVLDAGEPRPAGPVDDEAPRLPAPRRSAPADSPADHAEHEEPEIVEPPAWTLPHEITDAVTGAVSGAPGPIAAVPSRPAPATDPLAARPPVTRVPPDVAHPARVEASEREPWAPSFSPTPEADAFPETSAPVSAIAGAPAAGTPRSARASVSALHAQPHVPDEEGFDETIVTRRKRTPWTLVPASGRSIGITSSVVILGRRPVADPDHPDAQLVAVDDDTRTVSKTHARLELRDERWWIMDLHSTNGIVLTDAEGAEVDVEPGVEAAVGERFLLGDAEVRLERTGA